SSGQREPYSTYGPQVALAGPGENTPGHCDWDTQRDPCIFEDGGTSSATALVSASAALVWAAHPEWTKNQVLNALITTADGPGDGERNDQVGYGMVRPDRIILDNQGDPGDPDTNPLFAAWESLIDPPPSTEPNPTPTPHDNTPPPAGDTDTDDQAAADDTSEDTSGSNTTATLLLTLAAAVLLTGLTTAILLNR
ncbi:S8 family serine peptidase, partial [Streptomyces sp. 7-21]|uniref:S8 family serine peptidase n=1 Tax=Streptomyces sp. 7-21 TaxID=2802283 RepID=UPI00191CB0C4